jgi:hypothetical protein
MLICPLNSKINELTVSLGNYYDAMQVYLLSEGKYPSKEDALKIRNRFKNTPFYSSIAHYEDNLSIYRNFTTDGVVQGLDKAELAEVEKIFKNRGFKITVPLHTVQGSKRIKDTESWMFIVDTPMYQATEVSREEFLQDRALIEKDQAEDKIAFNKTDNTKALEKKLIDGFLTDFGITATEYDDLKEDLGLDAYSASDLITKAIAYKKGQSMLPEVAYFAYSMLGAQNNKIRSELRYLINKWDKYQERFDYHSKAVKEKEGFIEKEKWKNKIRDLVIIDFLQEKLQEHYKNPTSFTKVSDTKWTKEDFTLWTKIMKAVESFLANFSSKYKNNAQKLSELGVSIADEVLNNNYEYFDYKLVEDQIKKYYDETISSDPFAKSLVEFGQQKLGLILTGSLALRKVGEVYRTVKETLHDIDWVVPYDLNKVNGKAIEPLIEAFTGTLPKNLDSVDNYLEKLEWYKEFKAKYPSFKLTNGFYGKEHNNYESVTIQGVINGEFYDASGTHEETKSYYTKDPITKKPIESKKTIIVEHERGDWIKGTGYAIDFFVRLQPQQEEHENYFKLWKEIMIAKIKMGRPKDFTDWKAFVPFTKSKDSFNFNYEGYRHINWSQNNQKNSLEESTKQATAKTPVVDKQAKTAVVKMLDKLAKRFSVPYEIITAAKAKNLYDNYNGEKAFYLKGKVYILEDGITLENALHEFSHPFIRAIAQKNTELFTNIIEEILSTPEGKAIYNQVKELYPEHVVDGELNYAGFEEVAVRALTAEAEKQYTTPEFESAVQRLLKAIKNLLRGLFSTNAVDTIDANTSLKDLATILLGDKAYDLGLQDDAIAFNKSVKYEIYNGLPFTEESLARMSDGEKRITVRTKVHPTGIYEYNGQRFKILNLGQKNIKDFKTPERVKKKFREEYKKGMFKHIDNFFNGKTNLFVYQIEKIDNSIVNEYVKEEPLDEDLVFTNATTNATVKAIKDWLVSKKDSALKHKSDTGLLSKLKKVEDIEEQLKQLSLAEIMGSIVDDVYSALADPNNPNSYLLQFKKIIQEVASAETREDAERVVEKIGAYKEYVAGLKIIDDLLNYQLAEENPNEGSTLAKLNGIKNALFELDKKIKDTAPYVLAIANKGSINEELRKNIEAYWPMIKKLESDRRELEAKGEKIEAAALKSKKEDLERKLGFPLLGDLTQIYLEGGNDINFFERMVKTVANTTDAAIGLFYKRYKEEIDKGRKKINELTKSTYYKYKQFTEGKSIDNFEQLYEKMTEDVDVLRYNEDSGQYETFTEKWFISDFDQNAYNLKRKQSYDLATLEEKKARDAAANGDNEGYKEGMDTARRIRANFRRNNTIAQDKLESRDKVIEILLQKEKLFDNSAEGKSQFYAWVTNHLYNEELYIEYVSQEDPTKIAEYGKRLLDSYIQNKGTKVSGMFLVPDKTKFPNAKYNALTTEDRKYYDHLLSVYKESQKLLPEFERPGLRVPSVEKDIKDILIEQKDVKKSAVAAWERNFKNHIEDASKGIVYKGQTKRIPVYFNQSMAADTVSMNLTDTVMKFAEMAEQFKINSSLESLALLTKETIAERTVEKKTSTGKKILSALHKKMYGEEVVEPIKFAETEAYKMFESWLDSNFYNERRYAANLGTVRLDKVVDTMMAANALSVLGADGLKALTNRLTAGVNIAIESLGNKYFTTKTLAKGKAKVGQLMYATAGEENLLMDTLRGVKTTHFGQMLDIFQAIQGENDAVDEIGGSLVKRNASTSLLMWGLSAGEFIAQANMFAAIAYNIKIKTKSGEEISLLDAYIKEADGIVRLRKDVEFTLEDEQLLRNKINAINKELHGVYNKIDEVEAKKNWVGRALIQFRNFLVPNVERRFQELHVNFEMNDIVEGYYKTLYRKMVTERNFKIWQIYNDPSLTENERNNLKKAVVELTSYFVLAAIASILGSMGDDDDELKDNYAYNVALYSALRLKGEIGFFIPGINLKEGYRIIKSPSAINTLLERSVKFGGQLFTDPFGEYERNSGPWEKGDSKLKAKFLKLFFGYNGSNLDPSIAVENFKGLSN